MTAILIIVALVAGFLYVRRRILGRFVDPVTLSNQRRLGRYLLVLVLLFWLVVFWMASSMRH